MAMMMDPSYVKGHYRYKSALEALGEKDKAARVDARIRQFTALSVNDGKEVVDPGFWLGFRLVLCFQKNYSECAECMRTREQSTGASSHVFRRSG